VIDVVVPYLHFPEEAVTEHLFPLAEHGVQSVSGMDPVQNEVVEADALVQTLLVLDEHCGLRNTVEQLLLNLGQLAFRIFRQKCLIH
jgi:hypothetical protein